jgi:hypothetical protein
MSSRIEQATVALVALLEAIPGVTVRRNDDVPVNFVTETTPVLNIIDADDAAEPNILQNIAEFTVGVSVAGYVTAADSDDLGPARDALWTSVWKILDANYALGGLTWNVTAGATQRRLESEPGKPVAVFELPVTLHVKAQASDPAVAA